MKKDRIIQVLAAGVMVVALTLGGVLAVGLNTSAGINRLVYTEVAEKGDPPEVAMGIAMGAFRGIFVNYLWMRANDLKEEGKYWEAIELSKAITRLQPRFPRVWVFHAWNMAYNISVKTSTPEERWTWVQAGIRLLRDEAIPANPTDLILHRELAWLYLHKVQAYADDANGVYKRKVAEEFTVVMGEPPQADPAMADRETAVKRYVDWLRAIADAPASIEEVHAADPMARDLIARVGQVLGEESYMSILQRWEVLSAVRRSGRREYFEKMFGTKHAQLMSLVTDARYAGAWDAFVRHMRKRVLEDDYHYDLERMIRVTEKYGPMDWRHAASHAVYWSSRGVELSLPRFTEENKNNFDFVNTDRMTIQAVQELARTGEVYFNFLEQSVTRNSTYIAIPNPHFIETYGRILEELTSRSWADTDKRAWSFYSAGYENFLADQIRYYFRRGQRAEAEDLYRKLRTYPGQNMNDPDRDFNLSRPIEEFVVAQLFDRQTSPDVARSEIVGSLQQSFVSGLLVGNNEVFRREREYAKQQHRYYFEEQYRINQVTPEIGRMELIPRDFNVLEGQVFAALVSLVGFDEAQVMYGRAPDDLRVHAYDVISDRYRDEVAAQESRGGKAFDLMFPEPPGLAAHRAKMARLVEEDRRRDLRNQLK
ncbi:MAG: hypothetical protein KF787_02625 [Phycisphaeraceae bacterium]|nr:hypothetical protein [Phycisphaerae bacterium]MBX3391521.1 hypothetical protein [Phycisphaeraceae bacterium]